ncbi:COG4 transport protein-domain-containing protein, partial [Protomyces lactucae-debilis]
VYAGTMAAEVHAQLADLTRQEDELSSRFDTLLASSANLSRNLHKLGVLQAQAQSLQSASSSLLSTLESSASTAERISNNVRNLDAEQSRVKETLKYVEEVKELKMCVLGVHQSMEMQEWETAAELIHRASLVPEQIASGQFAAMMVPTAEAPLNPAVTIRDASDQLFHLFTRQFKQAIASRDTREITRFFKLFPQINKSDEGLDLYADFVSSIIAERADAALKAAGNSIMLYAGLMTTLFENIAKLLSNHAPLIKRFYGNNIDRVLARIQEECDKQGILILTTMMDDRQITKRISEIKSYSFSFLVQSFLPQASSAMASQAPEEREVDSRQLDALLTEISVILARWSLFLSFSTNLATPDTAAKADSFLTQNVLGKLLATKIQPWYELMEGYFMRRSVERAFQMEQQTVADAGFPISSVVEDVLFILRKITARALSTGQMQPLSSTFAAIRRVMEQDYAGVLGRRMQELQNRITSKTGTGGLVARSAEAEKRDRSAYLVLLNGLAMSAEYMDQMQKEHLKSPSLDLYADRTGAVRVVEQLATLKLRFSRGLEDGCQVLYSYALKAKIRPLVQDIFVNVSYMLDKQRYEEVVAAGESFSHQFADAWDALLLPVLADAYPRARDLLLHAATRALVRLLEKKLLTMRCTELGAIRLDRDMSGVI